MNYNKRPLYNFAGRLYNVYAYSPQHDGAVIALFPIMVSPHQTVQSIRSILPIESQYYTPELNKDKKSYQIVQVQNLSYMESDLVINKIKLESNLSDVFMLQHKILAKNDPIYGDYTECATAETADGVLKVAELHQAQKCLLIYKAKDTAEKAGIIMDRLSIETNATASPNCSPQKNMEGYSDVVKPDLRLKAEYKAESGGTPIGTVWTPSITTGMGALSTITYGNGIYVATSAGSDSKVWYSSDADVWKLANSTVEWISSVKYANGYFIAVSNAGNVYRSSNGADWVLLAKNLGNLYVVTFGNGCFFASDSNYQAGKIIRSCDNGVTWITVKSSTAEITNLTYGNGYLIGLGWQNQVLRSKDLGVNWDLFSYLGSRRVTMSIFINGYFIVPTADGVVRSSIDNGLTWRISNNTNMGVLEMVAFNSGCVFAVGQNGNVWRSCDYGINWVQVYQGLGSNGSIIATDTMLLVTDSTKGVVWRSKQVNNNLLSSFNVYY